MLKQSLVLLSSLLLAPAFADWTVAPEQSSLHFMSTKNAQVTEVHAFEELSGSVSDSGKLMIEVPLSSVNTNIPIRNTRMQEKLFNVAKFPAATFTADVPADLMKLQPGSSTTAKVDGTLSLHGVEAPVSFNVSVSKVSADTMVVNTVSPTLIGAETFGLTAGLDMLQNIAGLKSITQTSPVTFSVTFEME
ncbi:MAG: YceI family protein [Pseudomonadota bacterium]|jgi:polyisoprenoid-binding protein YceI|uniref:YceI family protein n=1 Tax=Alteromonas oceani TaxID=2071609 RepID=A0ABV7K1C8_9ALTE|nr:YceI family protein [Alteromonas oceani]MEC9262901.1 YceI family protein [Pseudomonadota bacterium]